MSEFAPPSIAGNAPPGDPALTPERIDAILADFRDWLRDSAALQTDAVSEVESIDLFTLVAQFTALRQEVNLQTRAVRLQQEQTAETLKHYGQGLQLLDAADTQQIAARELARVAATLPTDDAPTEQPGPPQPTLFGRVLGLGRFAKQQHRLELLLVHGPERTKQLGHIRGVVEAAASGLAMGLQRIERTMRQHDLEPIPAEGRPFDPEQMEVIEVAADSDRPSGEVVEEVRRGYLLRGRVFRFAQVKVAK